MEFHIGIEVNIVVGDNMRVHVFDKDARKTLAVSVMHHYILARE
jgi:hypothetical protein